MATFLEMKQYVERQNHSQILMQPKFGWCARVCLDIAIAYALQKTIKDLNTVNPNLAKKVTFNEGKRNEHTRNVLIGGFAEQIYNIPSQWKNGGIFYFNENDINSCVKTVMTKNNLWKRANGKKRLAPVFKEHKEGTIISKLSKVVEFLEEETPTTTGIAYSGLRVCLLQFVNNKKRTRHECIVCGTNKEERKLNPDLASTIDVYNPWGNISRNVNPNDLYFPEKTNPQNTEKEIRVIFDLEDDFPVKHKLETVRLFSFKWWK